MTQVYEARARAAANSLLDEVGVTGPPIDPENIVSAKGIVLEEWEKFPAGCYGALILDRGKFKIAVSSACPTRGHRRFTICHELGHYHLDGHIAALLSSGQHLSFGSNYRSRKDPYEIEADAFASELLVPRRFVADRVKSQPATMSMVKDVANVFDTSLSCAAIRVTALTDEFVAVLISNEKTIEWVAGSGPLRDTQWFRSRSWKGEWAPRGSGTYRLSADMTRIRRADEDGSTGILSEWFDKAPAVSVVEEAIGLGSYGRVLTVLSCGNLDSESVFQESDAADDDGRDRDWRDALRGYEWDKY